MSNFGVQSFVRGTTFDAVNSIDFNYVIDSFTAGAGTGSKSYSVNDGMKLDACMINVNTMQLTGTQQQTFAVSGNTVSWNLTKQATIVVIGSY